MSRADEAVTGTLREDGTVVLDAKPKVAPGRVRLWIEGDAVTEATAQTGPERAHHFRAYISELRAAQRARGHRPRSAAEVDADIRAMRDESEERLRRLDEISATGRRQA